MTDFKKISPVELAEDVQAFKRMPQSNRNAQDLRFGQYFMNKHNIELDKKLFYTEDFYDCVELVEDSYVDYELHKDV